MYIVCACVCIYMCFFVYKNFILEDMFTKNYFIYKGLNLVSQEVCFIFNIIRKPVFHIVLFFYNVTGTGSWKKKTFHNLSHLEFFMCFLSVWNPVLISSLPGLELLFILEGLAQLLTCFPMASSAFQMLKAAMRALALRECFTIIFTSLCCCGCFSIFLLY